MNFVDEMEQRKSIDLSSPGCCPTDINTSGGSLFTENDGATGQGLEVTGVPDLNPWNIGDGIERYHLEAILAGREGGVNEFMVLSRR